MGSLGKRCGCKIPHRFKSYTFRQTIYEGAIGRWCPESDVVWELQMIYRPEKPRIRRFNSFLPRQFKEMKHDRKISLHREVL